MMAVPEDGPLNAFPVSTGRLGCRTKVSGAGDVAQSRGAGRGEREVVAFDATSANPLPPVPVARPGHRIAYGRPAETNDLFITTAAVNPAQHVAPPCCLRGQDRRWGSALTNATRDRSRKTGGRRNCLSSSASGPESPGRSARHPAPRPTGWSPGPAGCHRGAGSPERRWRRTRPPEYCPVAAAPSDSLPAPSAASADRHHRAVFRPPSQK